MKARKAVTAFLLSFAVIASMFTAAYAMDATKTVKLKQVKITKESIEALLSDPKDLDGIVIITLPQPEYGTLCIGKRGLLRGEGVAVENLGELRFVPAENADADLVKNAFFEFTPVYADGSAGNVIPYSLSEKIRANNIPIAENIAVETFANVGITGQFSGIDPDADQVMYTLATEPKHGSVRYNTNGTFLYQPFAGKTGSDSFTYMACDDSGAVSMPATVTIAINEQSTDLVYADMEGSSAQYAALLLSENGIFTGKTIGGCTYFEPDAQVTRGEFIAMTVALTELSPETNDASSAFLDETEIPTWCRAFTDTAVTAGFIQGSGSEGARLLRANDGITRAEAAVILSNVLDREDADVVRFYADEELIPAWAKQAMSNVDVYGIMPADADGTMAPDTVLTRADAALILSRMLSCFKPAEVETGFWGWWR